MARTTSINILLSTTGKDMLAEQYGAVVENVMKNCISQRIKNNALSGDPRAGSIEAKRFENVSSNAYGTARSGGAGQAVKVTPVTININQDREIIREVEQKDVTMYGVEDMIQREAASAQKTMTRELEKAFFAEAVSAGTAYTPGQGVTAIEDIIEGLIQAVETVSNNFVDGVERDMISVVCAPATYGKLRAYFDKVQDGGAHGEDVVTFHGVRVYSSVYLPANTNAVAMADGAIAQPVQPSLYAPKQVELSEAIAFGLFFHYGTKAVAADLIFKY